MCHGHAEARGDTVEDYVNKVVVCHASIDIKAVDFGNVFLNCTYLSKGYNLVVGFIESVVVTIVYSDAFFNFDSLPRARRTYSAESPRSWLGSTARQ